MSETVFDKKGSVLTVYPEGRLDTATSPVLEKELQQHLDGVKNIIIDFERVEYISSAGLRVLLVVEQLAEGRGGSLRLIHVNNNILEILGLVGFLEVVAVNKD